MQAFLLNKGVELILPMLLGPVVFAIMQGLKSANGWVDTRPAWLKQALVVGIAAVISAGAGTLGTDLACLHTAAGCTVADIPGTAIKTALASGLAFAMHFLKKSPPA